MKQKRVDETTVMKQQGRQKQKRVNETTKQQGR